MGGSRSIVMFELILLLPHSFQSVTPRVIIVNLDVAEKGSPVPVSSEIWRTIVIRYGNRSQYRLVSDGDDNAISKIEESNLVSLSPAMSNLAR